MPAIFGTEASCEYRNELLSNFSAEPDGNLFNSWISSKIFSLTDFELFQIKRTDRHTLKVKVLC